MKTRRVHERHSCSIHVSIVYEGNDYQGTATNVSLGGMFVAMTAPLPYGAEVQLRFRLTALKEDSICKGTLRWKKPDGVGIQFGSLRALEVWGLNQLFRSQTDPSSSG